MKKRLLSIFLAVCMVFTLLPTSAFAATTVSGTCGDNLTWTLDSEGIVKEAESMFREVTSQTISLE